MNESSAVLSFPVHTVHIAAEQPLVLEQAIGLRGYYAAAYGHTEPFSRFLEQSRAYRYPRLQYKVVDGRGLILGFAEAAEILAGLPYPENLHLGRQDFVVSNVDASQTQGSWGLSPKPKAYRWLTPWLILDEAGLAKYFRLKSPHSQKFFLESLLISNLLAISKELGCHISGQIHAEIRHLKQITIEIHGGHTMGFAGSFTVNMEMPDYFGLGRSVARGYGTIRSEAASF
jgi:hypothetical protein